MAYYIYDGIISSGITLSSWWDPMWISSGGTANNTTVYSEGSMYICSGGTANKTTVNSGGIMDISSGGTANSTTVNYGGKMYINSGGTATNVIWTPCEGFVSAAAGAYVTYASEYSGVYFGYNGQLRSHAQSMDNKVVSGSIYASGTMYVMDGGVANSTTVNSDGEMYISSGGVANSTTVNFGGDMYIYSGGTANYTSLGNNMYISSGGVANNTVNGGNILIFSGGTANSTTVTSYGAMSISSGGTATNVFWTPCVGRLEVADGAYVTYASTYSSVYFGSGNRLLSHTQTMSDKYVTGSYCSMYVMSGGTANNTTVNSRGYMYISSGGTANSTTINDGYMNIFSGGTANSTTVSSGRMYISSGGVANGTTVNDGGNMYIYSGGTANSTTVNSWGYMYIYSGGAANSTTVNDGGNMYISSDGSATDLTLSAGGRLGGISFAEDKYFSNISNGSAIIADNVYIVGRYMHVSSCGTANSTTVNNGGMYIFSGGTANSTTVSSGGSMYISSGGTANSTTVNSSGYMYISSGGTANSTTVNYGYMYISSGGTANSTTVNDGGYMYITSGGTANGTTVNFWGAMDIESGGTANGTTVDAWGRMNISSGGVHRGSLQIESGGVISAAKGAKIDFTVAGRTANSNYLINDLSLIQGSPTYTITVDNDPTNGTYKLAQGADNFIGTLTIGNGTVDYGTITVNGTDFVHNGVTYSLDQVSGNLTLTITGGKEPDPVDGDLDGNGLADVILVHTKQGYSGAWLTTGTSSVIKWGSLSNLKAGTEILGTGRLFGSENDGQDIFFNDGKYIGAWNVVDGKVTEYKNIMNVNATTNVLGLGDFNGDGATDILLRSTNGSVGYYNTDGTGFTYLKGLGKEWTVAAIGDLNGDGLDDTVLRHDAGFAGTFLTQENGTVKWANLDTLSNDMTIVGTGDFNGDGVDDVLLQNKSNGWVGAWLVEDGSVDGFMGICKNKNSIEQIADFNGDGIDDLRIRAGADIGVLYVNGADDTTWQYFKSVGTEWDTSFSALA